MAADRTQRFISRLGEALRLSALIALTLVGIPSSAVNQAIATPLSDATLEAATSGSEAANSAGIARLTTKTDLVQIKETMRLPLFFEMNVGQDHPEVRARTLGAGLGVFLTARSVVFKLPKERAVGSDQLVRARAARSAARGRTGGAATEPESIPDVLSMTFVGAKSNPTVIPEEPLRGKSHYLRTDGQADHRNVAHYGRVRYLDVYRGIDKVHYGAEGKLEHDWIVKPGADPAQIVAEFEGASALELQPGGDLLVRSRKSSLTLKKPYAYQVIAGKQREVAAAFKIDGANRVTFAIGLYDKTRELIIDPVVEYLSYLSAFNTGANPVIRMSAAADGSLLLLVRSQGGFPNRTDIATNGDLGDPYSAFQTFVVKLNPAGTAFEYATTIVDQQPFETSEYGGLAVDSSGHPIFVGVHRSSALSPVCLPADETRRSFEGQVTGFTCGRLMRLGPDGSTLDLYVHLPIGIGIPIGFNAGIPPKVVIGASGDISVVAPFVPYIFQTPPTVPALQAPVINHPNDFDAGCGIFRYNPDGSGPVTSAYIRGCSGPSIAVDAANSLHIAYSVQGTRVDGPVPPPVSRYTTDSRSGRVARIDAAGTRFIYIKDLVADVIAAPPAIGRYTYSPADAALDASGNFNVVGSLVSRLDPDGNLISSLDPFAVVAPPAGCSEFGLNAYATPRFESVHFGPGGVGYLIGTTTWPQASNCINASGWIVKLAPTASQFQITNVQHFGATSALYSFEDLTLDAAGNLYVSGYSSAIPPAVGIPPRNPLPGQPYYPSGYFLAKFVEVPQLVTTPNPSIANTAVALRFEAPDPSWTGTVVFKRNGVVLSSAPITAGVASIVRSDSPIGTYTITADYSGDGTHAPVTLSTQHVAQANVFLTFVNLASIPVYPDECQDITLRATIPSAAGTLTAPIIFRHEYRELGRAVPNASRVADLNIGRWPLRSGEWFFNAYYAGDNLNRQGATGTVFVQIQAQNNVATLTQPLNNARFGFPSTVPITVAYTHTCLIPTSVQLYANNVLVKQVPGTASPIILDWTPAFEGAFVLRATLIMPNGLQPSTASVTVRVINGTYSDVQTTFLHTDAAGSPIAATDSAGVRIWAQEYDPFGLRVNPQPTQTGNRQWFHGKAVDTESGFSYFGARYYDTLLGRFMSVDPVGVKEDNIHSFNRYAFANNNPYRFTDPDGNAPEDLFPRGPNGEPAPIVTIGKNFGGIAAYLHGVVTGNESLKGAAVEGMREDRAANIEALAILATRGGGRGTNATSPASAKSAPDFIVSPSGTVFPVPRGAQGPTPVINPAGKQTGVAYTGGASGANKQVDTIRIMNPTPPRGKSPGYPKGYVKYENGSGQGVDPNTGRTLPNSQNHFGVD